MTGRPGAPLPVTEHPVPDRPRRNDHGITVITAAPPSQQPAAHVRPPPTAALASRPIPVTSRFGAPIPVTTQPPPASSRRRATDSDIASYRRTAQRVLDEHEQSADAPAGAPTRVRSTPSPAAPARATAAVAPWRAASFAAAAANFSAAQRSSAQAQQTQGDQRAELAARYAVPAGFGAPAPTALTPPTALPPGVAFVPAQFGMLQPPWAAQAQVDARVAQQAAAQAQR